jgi:MoaA/NifB/PqqE/SkfB family radical SAM enzyme
MNTWHILYRGSLKSCNYQCGYCPFAKTTSTPGELQQDEQELERFVAWLSRQSTRIGILFTPWGETLSHPCYSRAMTTLSHLPNVYRVAMQTNLSTPIEALADANRNSLALWTSFHPSQVSLCGFTARCRELDAKGIRYSVGVVGVREHFDAIDELRRLLRPEVYLWINAFKHVLDYYQTGEIQRLSAIDPYFHWNLLNYASLGSPCSAGETSFTVDGNGDIRRCHFIEEPIGNIYQPGFEHCLGKRDCSATTCGCHIGYIHRPMLKLKELYGEGLLERIPWHWPNIQTSFTRDALPEKLLITAQPPNTRISV